MRAFLKTYFNDYKRNQVNGSNALIFLGAFGGVVFVNGGLLNCKDVSEFLYVLVKTLVLLLPIWSNILAIIYHRLTLPKMMHLCPVEREEKKEFIYKTYYFKAILNTVITIISGYISYKVFHYQIQTVIITIMNLTMLSFLIEPLEAMNVPKKERSKVKGYICWMILMISTLLSSVLSQDIIDDDWMILLPFGIVFVMINIPLFVTHVKYTKERIENEIA